MDLKDKVVLVTGASRGIGAALAKAFAASGAIVMINYLKNTESAIKVQKEIEDMGGQSMVIQADVQDEQSTKDMMEQILDTFGVIDCVVNNALSHYTFNPKTRKMAWEMEWEDYQKQIEGNIHGSFNVCHAAIPFMKAQRSGRIINIVTNLIDFPIIPYHDYTTAKSGLLGFTKNLARDMGRFGITVNAVAPGLTYPTDSSIETQEDVRELLIRLTPMGRLAMPEDISGAVLFLASDMASFITGQCIRVDGGLV